MSEWQEVKSSTVSWGKVGDYIEGTLSDIRVREVRDDVKGRIRKNVYEIKADAGLYHEMDDKRIPIDPEVKVSAGDFYMVWGGKEMIDNGMKKAKIGQKVKVSFVQENEPTAKGRSGFKLTKVYLGVMDESFDSGDINPKDVF